MTLRLGVVGVGSLGFHHARILGALPGISMKGVHDTSVSRMDEVSTQLGVAAHASVDTLLDDVDAVVIAVPTIAHEQVALAAIERGVHILVEKPIAPSLESADRIVNAAEAAGVLVMIGHVERFNAAIRACEPYLEEPLFVESHRLAPFNPRGTDVAVVLDLMIHDVDLVLSLMKRPVSSVSAVGVPVLTPSVDIANARLEFEGGGVANLTASRVSLERMRKIRFFQRSGYISLDLAAGKGEYLRLKPGVAAQMALLMGPAAPGAAERAPVGIQDLVERITFEGDGAEPLARELERFIAALRGEAAIPVSGHDGRRALAVALDIVERTQRHVTAEHTA
ncbi:MAG: Gfo/Idh/MocA family oxidoreductase [Gemmatimonadetes bacterium]|nr:Gfo/Idh/MocA family oxidoreductase [Gemmatimonadota bacterium]